MLKELSSDANMLCQTLRNLTGRVESCYSLDSLHLDEFLANQHRQNETWRCFHPPEVQSRTLTTLQIYQSLRFTEFVLVVQLYILIQILTKRFLSLSLSIHLCRLSSKPTVILPLLLGEDGDEAVRFRNSTFIFRLYFLITSLHPVKVYIFHMGVVLLDKVSII